MDDKDEISEPETDTDSDDTDAENDVEEDVDDEETELEPDDDEEAEPDDDEEAEPSEIQKNNNDFSDDEDDDIEEEEDGENYLQKMDVDVRRNIISEHHPELNAHNYEEVLVACNIVRDTNGTIIDPLHKTLPFLTKYEKARILGERAAQINSGAKPFVEVDVRVIDGYLIALKEYEEKKIPFIIRRPIPNGKSEYWRFADLEQLY